MFLFRCPDRRRLGDGLLADAADHGVSSGACGATAHGMTNFENKFLRGGRASTAFVWGGPGDGSHGRPLGHEEAQVPDTTVDRIIRG